MHRRPNTMEQVDEDETKLIEISKHLIGVVFIYLQVTLGMMVAIGLTYFLLPTVIEDTEQAFFIGSIFAASLVVLAFIAVIFITVVYRQNRLIVTDRNITQVLQYGLFNRKVSQLNIVNIEDVTSIQNGFLPTMMNYGTLKIETAGEQSNFKFTFCPNSNHCAAIILDAREKMLGQMLTKVELKGGNIVNTAKGAKSSSTKTPKNNTTKQSSLPHKTKVKHLGAEVVEQTFVD
jgi:hypothetical protein